MAGFPFKCSQQVQTILSSSEVWQRLAWANAFLAWPSFYFPLLLSLHEGHITSCTGIRRKAFHTQPFNMNEIPRDTGPERTWLSCRESWPLPLWIETPHANQALSPNIGLQPRKCTCGWKEQIPATWFRNLVVSLGDWSILMIIVLNGDLQQSHMDAIFCVHKLLAILCNCGSSTCASFV